MNDAARDALIAFLAEQIVEEIMRERADSRDDENTPAPPQVATPALEAQNPAA